MFTKQNKHMITMMTAPLALSLFTVALASSTDGGTVFSAAERLIGDAQRFILTISTPAALVGVGIGAVTMKFAGGGDESNQKRALGKKAVIGSIIAWAAINGLMLILDTVQGYL
jgi:hypothetical protein